MPSVLFSPYPILIRTPRIWLKNRPLIAQTHHGFELRANRDSPVKGVSEIIARVDFVIPFLVEYRMDGPNRPRLEENFSGGKKHKQMWKNSGGTIWRFEVKPEAKHG